jgi:toxin ParE1/3/4
MAEVIWTDPALTGLDAIGDYIALDNSEAARKLIRRVFEKVSLFERSPSIGRVSKDLRNTPYRRLVIGPVYVDYRKEDGRVIVIHVVRAKRDFELSRIEERE